MPDNSAHSSNRTEKYLVPVSMLIFFLGIAIHTVFFLGVIAASMNSTASRNKKLAMAAFALFCITIAFGYSIGKDMAIRDNHAAAIKQDKAP